MNRDTILKLKYKKKSESHQVDNPHALKWIEIFENVNKSDNKCELNLILTEIKIFPVNEKYKKKETYVERMKKSFKKIY